MDAHSHETRILCNQLESPIKFSANEKTIDLPTADFVENSVATSTGWGSTAGAENKFSDLLKSLQETLISSSKCSPLFKDKPVPVDANDFCAVAIPGADKAGLCIVSTYRI